jgi:hypothetical protein
MLPESANIPDTNPNIGRRTFLLGLAGAGLTVALSSCGIDKPTTPANTLPTYTPSSASDGPNKTAQATAGESLAASDNPDLNLLAPYEVQLGQRLPEAMSFLKMPTDETSAAELAERTANFARDCAAAGVSPRFVMEPVNAEGEGIDLNKIIDATHTDALRNYLQNLKEQGVTGEQLGTFIPLPEPSVPEEWNGSNDAGLFRRNFTAVASTIKDVFPNTQICMMLDSASFPSGDWGARTYEAGPLLAYTRLSAGQRQYRPAPAHTAQRDPPSRSPARR